MVVLAQEEDLAEPRPEATDETVTETRLPIHTLAARHPGLTGGVAAYYTEAARVCLDRHHRSPIGFEVDNSGAALAALVEWAATDERTRSAHANEIDATEAGACACVLAAVELAMQMVAIHRADTRTGADYYVAPVGSTAEDLERTLRLEVSGTDKGSPAVVAQRVKAKIEQAAKGASNLPALAGVVGFKSRLIMLKPVPER
jgi:hypothetical protein